MATTILYCTESPNYSGSIGPGGKWNGKEIKFAAGFGELDDTTADFAERMSWINTPGAPHCEIVTEAEAITHKAVAAALAKAGRESHGLD